MRLYSSCLLSLSSFRNCNDCLGSTAQEALREAEEEHLGGHRRPEGQKQSLRDCRWAAWALGCRPAASTTRADPAAAACRARHEQRQEHGPSGGQTAPGELLLPSAEEASPQRWQLRAQSWSPESAVPSCGGCIPAFPAEMAPAVGRWLPWVRVTTPNTEFDLGATRDGDGRGPVGCHVLSAVVNQHSPTVLSTSWASGPLDGEANTRCKESVIF